jgi:4-hydroxy-tetrahydrodipicolinate synthase
MLRDHEVDYEGLEKLVQFQKKENVNGILAVGTTGESPTLNWEEHIKVIQKVYDNVDEKTLTIGGTGSNSTIETLRATKEAYEAGIECVLLVDPYYNGPSSLEIRKEYVAPVASRYPNMQIIPYVIPGRTGTQLFPADLAVLQSEHKNIRSVKEATGNLENMKLTRKLCGEDFDILSGDDDITYKIMTNPEIKANGVVSVASNVVPGAVKRLTQAILDGNSEKAKELYESLKPLFSLVTVKTEETTSFGPVLCKARNPVPYKTLMNILGMPSGPSRRPLGKMSKKGFAKVLETAKHVYEKTPEIFEPIEKFFDVDLSKRLYDQKVGKNLHYD